MEIRTITTAGYNFWSDHSYTLLDVGLPEVDTEYTHGIRLDADSYLESPSVTPSLIGERSLDSDNLISPPQVSPDYLKPKVRADVV